MSRTPAQKKKKNEARQKLASQRRTEKIIREHGSECAFVVKKMVKTTILRVLAQAKARDRARQWKADNSERKRLADTNKYLRDKQAAARANLSYKEYMARKKETNLAKPRRTAGERIKQRKATDENFLIRTRLRTRLGEFMRLKNSKKAHGTMQLLGCTQAQLLKHLQMQLRTGEILKSMQTDHVFAMELYNPSTEEMQYRVMNFSNLQPLTVHENVSKGKRLPTKAMAAKVARWAWPEGVTEDMLPDIYDGWSTPLRM